MKFIFTKEFINECISPKGRWNRKKFLLYPLAFYIPLLIGGGIFLSLSYLGFETIGNIVILLTAIFVLPLIWVGIMSYIKRFHDLDKSGWWTLTIFIPILWIIPLIYLIFFKGTEVENRFGPNPLSNISNGNSDKKTTIEL